MKNIEKTILIKKMIRIITPVIIIISVTLTKNVVAKSAISPKNSKKTINEQGFSSISQGSAYTTGIGFRAGFTSGLTAKHFISSSSALEGILGTRYRGFSFTGLYELHKDQAFDVPNLTWEYGLGGRIGFYDRNYYHWKNNYSNSTVVTIGVVGILGLEYKFDEVPFTASIDIMPFVDFIGWGNNFIDGSISIRYILK